MHWRRELIDSILTTTQTLSEQLAGLVPHITEALTPALAQLSTVTDILARNRQQLGATVQELAPFVRVFTNTLGNGRWFDSFVDNLVPGVLTAALCGGSPALGGPQTCTPEGEG